MKQQVSEKWKCDAKNEEQNEERRKKKRKKKKNEEELGPKSAQSKKNLLKGDLIYSDFVEKYLLPNPNK